MAVEDHEAPSLPSVYGGIRHLSTAKYIFRGVDQRILLPITTGSVPRQSVTRYQ